MGPAETSARRYRKALCVVAALCSAASSAAGAGIGVSIVPGTGEGAGGAYRGAIVGVDNRSGQAVRAVAVRMIEGGPTFLLPLAVPPDSNAALAAMLPAIAAEQAYIVKMLAHERVDASAIAEATVLTSWPAESVHREVFLDPDAQEGGGLPSEGIGGLARGLFLSAVLVAVALCTALLLRRTAWRVAAALAIVLVATVSIPQSIASRSTSVRTQEIPSTSAEPNRPPQMRLAISCLRTTRWDHLSARNVPVYGSLGQMRHDDAVVHPGKGLAVTVRAGQTRVFRVTTD